MKYNDAIGWFAVRTRIGRATSMKRFNRIIPLIVVVVALTLSAVWVPAPTRAQDSDPQVESWIPAPTGPYQVGRTTRSWVDETRDEPNTDDPNDHRELVVRIWYPAEPAAGAVPAPYFEDMSGPAADAVLSRWNLDSAGPKGQALIGLIGHAYAEAPIVPGDAPYPVVIMSSFLPEQHTSLLEELASQGYVAVGVYHAYSSVWVVLPDGSVIENSTRNPYGQVDMLARDIISVMNELTVLNTDDPGGMFSGQLNLEQIGAVGWWGWSAPVCQAAILDSRIRAVVNEDGDQVSGLEQPYLYFTTNSFAMATGQGPRYTIKISGASTDSYRDYPPAPSGAPSPAGLGATDARTIQIARAYVVAFFDTYLKGSASPLLAGPSADYPEVNISIVSP
jgi:hypothetical protein